MDVKKKDVNSEGVKFFVENDGKEIARAYLYLMHNDLHKEPFGYMEDVFVEEEFRREGIGSQILDALIKEARNRGCYKLVGCSRNSRQKVHEIYKKLGFEDYGKEFRMNFQR